MKNTHILLSVLFIVLFSAGTALAQDDESVPPFSIGIRATPDGAGITGKYFFIDRVNVEAMFNGSGGGYFGNGPSVALVGLVEYNFIFNDPAWRIFLGPGAHVGSWKQYPDNNTSRIAVFGLDAIAGIEYVFTEVPIGVSADIKPAINFVNGVTEFPSNTFGFAVRFYFGSWGNKLIVPKDDTK